MRFRLTLQSRNRKTGPIPVRTTSSDTCPTSCPLLGNGCYAAAGKTALAWRDVDSGKFGTDLTGFVAAVRNLPKGQLWRHNQAGDLPGVGDAIDVAALGAIVAANRGRSGFTYTHKPVHAPEHAANREAVREANARGFVVNLSADTLHEADQLADLGIGPVVTVLPMDAPTRTSTPAGKPVRVCPAEYSDRVSCHTCGLCAKADRKSIIGFRAHGPSARKADAVARS